MPKKLNIIFEAQNDAQKFGVLNGRGCFLRYLMRTVFAQQAVVCHLWSRSGWRHTCAESYVVRLMLAIDELQQEVLLRVTRLAVFA